MERNEGRGTAKSFEDVIAWQKAHALVLAIFRATHKFPREEIYGLTSQIRRAAVSIPANIAEGFKRRGPAEKVRLYNIAQGSLEEVRYFLILARDLGYLPDANLLTQADQVAAVLAGYSNAVRRRN